MAARARSRFDQDDAPRSDVYTGLLALSLIAMIVSCLLLWLDFAQYSTMKAPSVTVPPPKVREGVAAGQLPPPLLTLPPPAPVGERPFTRGHDTAAAKPVSPAGGEEAQAPAPAPVPAPVPENPTPAPVVEQPPVPAPVAPQPVAEVPAPQPPAPEPVAPPPTPAPAPAPPPPAAAEQPPAPAAPVPAPPPLPKSIRSLPH
ncbi:MAG TPA: hypothetical protein VGF55_30315 [Gemmataceae bacterium]|jgi:hypothetical protein